jgi:glycosyltransferase involved in cell wall biosynthesis
MNLVFIAPFGMSPKATVSARMMPMASALVRRNHQVTILIPPYDHPADAGKRWTQSGVQIENTRATGLLGMAWQMARRAQQLGPDLYHVFKPVGPGALAMWLLYMQGERRFVVDNDDWEGPGGWLDVNPYPALHKVVLAWQERWALRQARAVTCASEVLITRTQELTHTQRPVMLFPNGPDEVLREQVSQAQAQREALRAQLGWLDGPVVIYAGTVPLNHDMDMAVSAIKQALASHPSLRWDIVATGDGLASLQANIQQAGIGAHVQISGFMPHEQLVQRLVAADVAVYPYRDSNINRAKCSGKVIDYMACGKPMVVSDVGMNRVYLAHSTSGLLTAPGDGQAFAAALMRLLDDPASAAQMGLAAQRTLWQRFSWADRITDLEQCYANALNARSYP